MQVYGGSFETSADVILFENIQNQFEFNILLSNLTFSNLQADEYSNILKFMHQTSVPLTMDTLNLQNLTNLGISVESFDSSDGGEKPTRLSPVKEVI